MADMDVRDYFGNLPPLQTARLTLRSLRLRDAESLFECTGDPEVARYVLWTANRSVAECRGMIRSMHRRYRAGLPCSYGIALREDDRVYGTIGFTEYHEELRTAEVGYSLARRLWGQGLATEALAALLDLCFGRMRLHRVEAVHDVDNPASGRVMQHCGMRFEGTIRGRVFNKGEWRDVCQWAMLAEDWAEARRPAAAPRPSLWV